MNRLTRRSRTGVAGLFVAVATLALGAIAVPASAHPSAQVDVRPATARISDEDNGFLIFVNRSRAALCTPERIAYENAFVAWLDGGAQGDPPVEPASSQQGVKPVVFTDIDSASATLSTIAGPNLPVEVWREENDSDGIDCTATDGPGAELFATGLMTWTSLRVETANSTHTDLSIAGTVKGTDGQKYRYSVRYVINVKDGAEPDFHSTIRLTPIG